MPEFAASPTANAIRTLELLQNQPGIAAATVAELLGVTDRAVRRYIAILREAGIPVESVRGRYGGYQLGRSLQPPPLLFTAGEALGLVMAVLDGHHAAADPHDPVGSALGKLIRSLPSQTARQAALVREHAMAAPDRHAARPDQAIIGTLIEAIALRRGVRFGYTSASGSASEPRADPWAVVVRHGRWYLLSQDRDAAAARAFRVDRIHHVDILNVDVDAPADLNPVAWLEAHLGAGWPFSTEVEFAAPYEVIAPYITVPMGSLEHLGDGRCLLRGTTNNPTMYAGEWLAAIPHPFTVHGGEELRDAVRALGERFVAASDGGSSR